MAVERLVLGGLAGPDVQTGCADLAGVERLKQGVLVDVTREVLMMVTPSFILAMV